MTVDASSPCMAALDVAVRELQRARHPDGYWEGTLSSSALATATAVSAFSVAQVHARRAGSAADRAQSKALIENGTGWLVRRRNADGGWGDTVDSPSNIATTLLAVSALTLAGQKTEQRNALADARRWLAPFGEDRAAAVLAKYGEDRTFAVPILANAALAGLTPWSAIPALPYEMALLPHAVFRYLRMQVVSYALPALIALGLLAERRQPSKSVLRRGLRRLAERPALRRLRHLQPVGGGFLEAVPLTAFTAMSLASLYGTDQPVVRAGLDFLRRAVRADGSWPIDSNLSVWLTSSAVKALASAGRREAIGADTIAWLGRRQGRRRHPYTDARPGGWGWTHLPGGVPDTDDTAGATLVLSRCGEQAEARRGAAWLLNLQNADGGWPTFCRGWGRLPFDTSAPDLTAHALRALRAVERNGGGNFARDIARGLRYLERSQQEDGSWRPLWFGSCHAPDQVNRVLGAGFVLRALNELAVTGPMRDRATAYLLNVRNADGGWGGVRNAPSTMEETAVAVAALADADESAGDAARRGALYLAKGVQDGAWRRPAPIGLYFASLWYSEALYPLVWTVDALGMFCGLGTL